MDDSEKIFTQNGALKKKKKDDDKHPASSSRSEENGTDRKASVRRIRTLYSRGELKSMSGPRGGEPCGGRAAAAQDQPSEATASTDAARLEKDHVTFLSRATCVLLVLPE